MIIAALFPPNVIGGAEMSAFNAARWFAAQGCTVGVLTTAASPDQVCEGKEEQGLLIWRVHVPRLYPMFEYPQAPSWKKPSWHFQDHFDPRNKNIIRRVLNQFKPTNINIHIIQGIGYNSLDVFGGTEYPIIFFLHDLGLVCVKMSMFKNGKDCIGQCSTCKLSARCKLHWIRGIKKIGFCSPSRANLETVAQFFPVKDYPHVSILNPNKYPDATVIRKESDHLRFLYVGRLQPTKGVDVLLDALRSLYGQYHFSLTLIGTGPDEARLRAENADKPWVKFTGFISQQEISNYMVQSDVMFIPSIWAENSPGVVVHALGLGLPVIGSNRGGIPELIIDGTAGALVEPGDVAAWRDATESLLRDHSIVARWRVNALANKGRFEQDTIGNEVIKFMQEVEYGPGVPS